MGFEFSTATKIVFGRGALEKLPALCLPLGKRFLIVADPVVKTAADALAEGLARGGAAGEFYPCAPGEPTVESVDAAVSAESGRAPMR
jgi:alcohol dehydrogenase class IV